jgi:sporulation protein YlmC with PRC-barrel domain
VASEHRLRELEEKYEGFTVYDNQGEKIGKVDDLFVDDADREEYIGVKMGFLGRKSTLIPMEIVRVNERDKSIEVSESKSHVKNAPSFDDDEDITPDYEERIRSHFGLGASEGGRGGYGAYSGGDDDRDRELDREGDMGSSSHGGRGSSEAEGGTDHDTSSESGYGDRTGESSGTSAASSGGAATAGSGGGESSSEGRFDQEGSGQESSSGSSPVTRQTEETETFEEGGRTKVRRRIIREEIVEEDADDR